MWIRVGSSVGCVVAPTRTSSDKYSNCGFVHHVRTCIHASTQAVTSNMDCCTSVTVPSLFIVNNLFESLNYEYHIRIRVITILEAFELFELIFLSRREESTSFECLVDVKVCLFFFFFFF